MQIYVHVPFCKSKCLYCDFTSFRCKSEIDVLGYLTALNSEIDKVFCELDKRKITTVYIGGGTPSVLSVDEFDVIAKSLSKYVDLSAVDEFTVECNPESIDEEKLRYYKSVGVNRLSIGVQSLNNDNLHAIGRLHNAEKAINAVKLATSVFDNVSVDFIVGLPFDNFSSVENEIATLAPLVKHVSVYTLQVEENTPLEKLVNSGKVRLPDDDGTEDLLAVAMSKLRGLGFERYEISNFAKAGYESKHNSGYWTREEYYGFGLGASSLIKRKGGEFRLKNTENFSEYISSLSNGKSPVEEEVFIDENEIKREKIMLGLRLKNGIDESLIEDKIDLINGEYSKFFARKDGNISFNDDGMNVSNYILSNLVY